jgi:hypothetical protein
VEILAMTQRDRLGRFVKWPPRYVLNSYDEAFARLEAVLDEDAKRRREVSAAVREGLRRIWGGLPNRVILEDIVRHPEMYPVTFEHIHTAWRDQHTAWTSKPPECPPPSP